MRANELFYFVTFYSKQNAIYAEKILKSAGIMMELYEAPRYVARGCNLGLRINGIEPLKRAVSILSEKNIQIYVVFLFEKKDNKFDVKGININKLYNS